MLLARSSRLCHASSDLAHFQLLQPTFAFCDVALRPF